MTEPLIYTKLEPLQLSQEDALVFEWRIVEADDQLLPSRFNFLWRKEATVLKRIATLVPIYERIKCNEFKFVFKYDEDNPEMLHIHVRHLTTTDDAIGLFFSQDPVWDEKYKRFENYSETHGLYWFWLNELKKVVMVVSCFRLSAPPAA